MESTDAPDTPESPPALRLRISRSLAQVPQPRDVAAANRPPEHAAKPAVAPGIPSASQPSAITAHQPASNPPTHLLASAQGATVSRDDAPAERSTLPGVLPLTATLGGVALVASLAWMIERRRTLREQDSVLWADVQTRASSPRSIGSGLDDILPDGPSAAEKARAIFVTAIGETNSRREATLIDLHQLQRKLERRRKHHAYVAAVLLLQQHLVDFRFTSPWVFLELRELYLKLNRQSEWEVAREAFRTRFGQNAPLWTAPSTADAQLLDDSQLCAGVTTKWPYRAARMWLLLWMLGGDDMRQRAMGPPLLPLGVYRDMMTLDTLLDDVMMVRPPPAPAATPAPAVAESVPGPVVATAEPIAIAAATAVGVAAAGAAPAADTGPESECPDTVVEDYPASPA